jgi:putative membrane protein
MSSRGERYRPGETQPERTALAWQRTGLGILAVAGLLAHGALESELPAMLLVAGVAALFGLAVLGALAPVRYRQVRRLLAASGRGRAAPGLITAVTALVALVALAAVAGLITLR